MAKVAKKPVLPTEEEIELHNCTHIPFRSWCAFCVAGKAKAMPHYSPDDCKPCGVPVVSIDYAFIGKKPATAAEESLEAGGSDEEEEVGKDGKTLTVLVLRDRQSKYVTASVVPRKSDHPYTVHRVGQDIACVLGYKRVILKSDQEPAIKKLKAAVRREWSLEIPDEYSPVGDSQSNGAVEISVQVIEGQVRTLKCQIEHRLGRELPMEHPVLPWMVRHAGATISRYQKGPDGMTAYRRIRGRDFHNVVVEFG